MFKKEFGFRRLQICNFPNLRLFTKNQLQKKSFFEKATLSITISNQYNILGMHLSYPRSGALTMLDYVGIVSDSGRPFLKISI